MQRYTVSYDNDLTIKICQGLRLKFNIKVPQLIVNLTERCLGADVIAIGCMNIHIQRYFQQNFKSNRRNQ
jgi:hypothetical protein